MRFLLSTIGSRGEIQPVLALAGQLTDMGQEVVVCGPPDFRDLAASLAVRYVPVGPPLSGTAKRDTATVPTVEQRRRMIEGTVAAQFAAVGGAAEGCDVVVGGGALAVAAHSVAQQVGADYVYAAFAPVTLPSPHHAPPVLGMLGQQPAEGVGNRTLWSEDAHRWNVMWGEALNARRAALGLPPVADVRDHIVTGGPWLAADPTVAPWPEPGSVDVFQTGAWILPDHRPLPARVEAFLRAGDPPVHVGFGSVRAPDGVAGTAIEVARSLGRRVVLGAGWAELSPVDDGPDCLVVGEVNQQALFARVAAVVHHGGAGTTTTAAAAGAPQVVVPQGFDQFYFAGRVERLGIGSAHPAGAPTVETLTAALGGALRSEVAEAARRVAGAVRRDGASTAAARLIEIRRSGRDETARRRHR